MRRFDRALNSARSAAKRERIMTYLIATIVGVVVLLLDQLTKYLVVNSMSLGDQPIVFIKGFLNFHYITNSGAAFGTLQGKTWLLIGITFFLMLVCVGMLIKKTYRSPLMYWAIMLVLAGGIGNMIDRIFRGGQVVDFIETAFMNFPIFNVADISVCVGAGLVFVYFLVDLFSDTKKKANPIDSDMFKE